MSKILIVMLFFISSMNSFAGDDDKIGRDINELRFMINEFAMALMGRLQKAMDEGGADKAIQICHTVAPEMAQIFSDKYHLEIGRTSLRTRNSNNNPDQWEQAVLNQFERRKQNGEDISKLEYYETKADGFRYMKAIPTQDLCIVCHGENIAEPIKTKLASLYPRDKAIGFKTGDIRGAFTVRQR